MNDTPRAARPEWIAALRDAGIDFDACHEKIRQIIEYWFSIHPETGLPGRQHFDPIDVPRHLRNLRLLDVVDGDPPRFRTRLMGTYLVEFFGQEQTGLCFDEIYPNFEKTKAFRHMTETVATKRPNWYRGKPILKHEKDFATIERVFLPFAQDGNRVDLILSCILFGDEDGNFC